MRWAMACAFIFACGHESTKTPATTGDPRAVPLGEWCSSITQVMCIRAGSCIGSLEIATTCQTSAQESCLGGRAESSPSGHTAGDLDVCEKTLQNVACDGYMANATSHTECQAHP